MTRYRPLFSLQIRHPYYRDELCRDVRVAPDSTTRQGLSTISGIFRQQEVGCSVFVPDNVALEEIVEDIPLEALVFDVVSGDNKFFIFTDFPVDTLGRFEFSSKGLSAGPEPEITLRTDFLVTDPVPGNIAGQIVIDPSGLSDSTVPQYLARFPGRSTRWKYYFINSSAVEFQHLELQGRESSLFGGPEEAQLPTGQKALCFDSGTNLIALKETGQIDLSLSGTTASSTSQGGRKILIDHLPNAGPAGLQMDEVAGQKEFFTAIYVYL